MEEWIYEEDEKARYRYVLGVDGENPMLCFGINPSTAKPGELDNTVRRVENFAKDNGYDGWIMLNLYSQRSTDPKGIHKRMNRESHKKNLEVIENIFKKYENLDAWAAWGVLIEKRDYFIRCLKDIKKLSDENNIRWIHLGEKTKAGHPRHPLYLRGDSETFDFDLDDYIKIVEGKI